MNWVHFKDKFQIGISSNSREIRYQNIGRTLHRYTHYTEHIWQHTHTHRQTGWKQYLCKGSLRGHKQLNTCPVWNGGNKMNDLNPALGSMKTNWIKWFFMVNGQVHLSGRIGTANMATYPPTFVPQQHWFYLWRFYVNGLIFTWYIV